MTVRQITTCETNDNTGVAIVQYDDMNGSFYIEYFDDNGNHVYREEYVDKTQTEVETVAQDWANGKHEIGDVA